MTPEEKRITDLLAEVAALKSQVEQLQKELDWRKRDSAAAYAQGVVAERRCIIEIVHERRRSLEDAQKYRPDKKWLWVAAREAGDIAAKLESRGGGA
jgi:hypothetical protein